MNAHAHTHSIAHDDCPVCKRIVKRGRCLAHVAYRAAGHELARVPKPHLPARGEFGQLEDELARPLSAAEETTFIHAYRTELHALNAKRELARMTRRGDA